MIVAARAPKSSGAQNPAYKHTRQIFIVFSNLQRPHLATVTPDNISSPDASDAFHTSTWLMVEPKIAPSLFP